MSDIVIYRYHVDAIAGEVTIEFRTKDPDTGRLDPPVGYARHTVPISQATLDALGAELTPLIEADLAQLPSQLLRSHAVTSELHALRDTRDEHERAKAALERTKKEHADHLVRIEEAKTALTEHLTKIEAVRGGR